MSPEEKKHLMAAINEAYLGGGPAVSSTVTKIVNQYYQVKQSRDTDSNKPQEISPRTAVVSSVLQEQWS